MLELITRSNSLESKRTVKLLKSFPPVDLQRVTLLAASRLKGDEPTKALSLYLLLAEISSSSPEIAKFSYSNWNLVASICYETLQTSTENKKYYQRCLGAWIDRFLYFSLIFCYVVKQCIPKLFVSNMLDPNSEEHALMENKWETLLTEAFLFHLTQEAIDWPSVFLVLYNLVSNSPWEGFKGLLSPTACKQETSRVLEFLTALKKPAEGYEALKMFLILFIYLFHLKMHFEQFVSNDNPQILFCCPLAKPYDAEIETKRRRIEDPTFKQLSHLTVASSAHSMLNFENKRTSDIISHIQSDREGSWLLFSQAELFSLLESYEESSKQYAVLLEAIQHGKMKSHYIRHSENWKAWIRLRMASNIICMHDHKRARRLLFEITSEIPYPNFAIDKNSVSFENISFNHPNELKLYNVSSVSIGVQCIKYLTWSYRETETMSAVCVLHQYGWPYFRSEFKEMIQSNEFRKGFRYDEFLNFVVNVDVLEEFMFMLSSPSWTIHITPDSTSTSIEQKEMIIKHVQQLYRKPSVETVIKSFSLTQTANKA